MQLAVGGLIAFAFGVALFLLSFLLFSQMSGSLEVALIALAIYALCAGGGLMAGIGGVWLLIRMIRERSTQ